MCCTVPDTKIDFFSLLDWVFISVFFLIPVVYVMERVINSILSLFGGFTRVAVSITYGVCFTYGFLYFLFVIYPGLIFRQLQSEETRLPDKWFLKCCTCKTTTRPWTAMYAPFDCTTKDIHCYCKPCIDNFLGSKHVAGPKRTHCKHCSGLVDEGFQTWGLAFVICGVTHL